MQQSRCAAPVPIPPRPLASMSPAGKLRGVHVQPAAALVALMSAALCGQDDVRALRQALCADLRAFATYHLEDKQIPGIWIAIADVDLATGDSWSWATALSEDGWAPRAAVSDVHRVASVGKLVTATMAMVLAQRGTIELDAPVLRYVESFRMRDPRAAAITLRQLLQHTSGLSRDCPVGNMDDSTSPGLAATVQSLNDTELLFAPGADCAYSNPGYALVGYALERAAGRRFETLAEELVFGPLGLQRTSFSFGDLSGLRDDFARSSLRPGRPSVFASLPITGRIWTLDGRAFPPFPLPRFPQEFGCVPAVNLFSTVTDLVAFAHSWLPSATVRVLDRPAQESMWVAGSALAFYLDQFDGTRRVRHGGTVPGTATELVALPDEGLIAAVVVNLDFANDIAEAIAERALRAMRAGRIGERLSPPSWPVPLGRDRVRALVGRYVAGNEWFDLRARGDDLWFDPCVGIGSIHRDNGKGWIADDPCVQGKRMLQPGQDRIFDGAGWFVRRPRLAPRPAPAELLPLLGEYGTDDSAVIVYEDEGRLGVLLQWHVRELPERVLPDRWEFPPGSFGGETLRFVRDDAGLVTAAIVQNVTMPRRAEPPPGGFRIAPVRAIEELRREAAAATPPEQPAGLREPDLVELTELSETLRFDIRYATADNFLGTAVYERAHPRLQRPAAEALLRAHRRLAELGYGLLVFDGYRPWSVTKVFWDATPESLRHFVADPQKGSRHNRGCAVDLTLYDLATGAPVPMPSDFDEFTVRAYPDWPGGTTQQRWHRDLLRKVMEDCGFTIYEHEWWHFDYRDWQQYPVLNVP